MNERTDLFRVYVGNKTDIAYNDVYDSLARFDEVGLEYEFDGVNPDAGHNWNAWQENLIDFAPRLFTGRTRSTPGSARVTRPWMSASNRPQRERRPRRSSQTTAS